MVEARDEASLSQVRGVMRPARETVHPNHELEEALVRLDEQEHHVVPVLDGDEVVGVLARSDIDEGLRSSARPPHRVTVRHVKRARLVFCYEDDHVDTARAMMDRHGLNEILVVDRLQYLVGLVQHADLPPESGRVAAEPAEGSSAAHPRESMSEGVSSNIQPGGLEVYPERPTIRIGR